MYVGRHRGDPLDESPGVLPILDGVIAAVEAERDRTPLGSGADVLLRDALIDLQEGRRSIVAARDVASQAETTVLG